jgi:hypothetical protein
MLRHIAGSFALAAAFCVAPGVARADGWAVETVARFANGEGDGALGVMPGGPDEKPRGPEAILALPDGRVAVADNLNDRLVTFTPVVGAAPKLTPLVSGGVRAVATLAVTREGELAALDQQSERWQTVGMLQSGVWSAAAGKPGRRPAPVALRWEPTTMVRAMNGSFLVSIGWGNGRGGNGYQIQHPVGGSSGRLASVTVLRAFTDGRAVLRLETIESEQPLKVRRFLQFVSRTSGLGATVEVPIEDVIVPAQEFSVADDGQVFVLLPTLSGTEIRRFTPPGR